MPPFELEHAVGGVIGSALVGFAGLVDALWNVRGAGATDRLHRAKGVVENVAPMAVHVENDSAVVFLSVIPRGTLRGLPVAFEDPVAELSAHGEDAAEETGIDEAAQLANAGQEKLVLDDALLEAGFVSSMGQLDGALACVVERGFSQ